MYMMYEISVKCCLLKDVERIVVCYGQTKKRGTLGGPRSTFAFLEKRR